MSRVQVRTRIVECDFDAPCYYEECETIYQKIVWLEIVLQKIQDTRDSGNFKWNYNQKNDFDNEFNKEKLYNTRLRILRKQFKNEKNK
tara:strand:- start:1101 stop:1364 length:264 start_codon:yes stop_codon:yes gene_type:complete